MQKKLSIKEIAKLLGTSTTTVSFVINGKAKEKHISDEVTKKVLKLVSDLNYQPNSLAKSLRTGKSKIIGFLVDDISKPFFSRIARLIDEKASAHGYKLIFSSTGNDKERAAEILRIYKERHVDGYIIALANGIEDEVTALVKTGEPVVLFDRHLTEIKTDYVLTDNFLSTFEATQHLIDNQFKNIGFVTIETNQQQMLDRLSGYTEAIGKVKMKPRVLKITYQNSENSIQEIKNFITKNADFDAVIFATNYLTMDGLRLSRLGNSNLLNGKALISFDDFELLEFITPSVTAVEQPIEAIAENIVKLLLKRLDGKAVSKNEDYSVIKLGAKLNVRQSTYPSSKII